MFKNTINKETYKEIRKVGSRYKVQWDEQPIIIPEYDSGGTRIGEYEDPHLVTCMEEIFNFKPELSTLQTIINDYYNKQINEEIILGFTYEVNSGVTIYPYLSNENQMNYKNAYDLVSNEATKHLVLPYKVKNSNGHEPAYYEFTTAESFKDFYLNMLSHIQNKLHKAWDIKDNIDWSKYEYKEMTGVTDDESVVEVRNSSIIEEETSVYSPNEDDMKSNGDEMHTMLDTATTTTSTTTATKTTRKRKSTTSGTTKA